MSSYALWRRALARVDRRALAYLAAVRAGHAFQRAEAHRLLAEACRLANQLAPIDAPRLRAVR